MFIVRWVARFKAWRARSRDEQLLRDAQAAFRAIDKRMKAARWPRQRRRQVWNDLVHERRPDLP